MSSLIANPEEYGDLLLDVSDAHMENSKVEIIIYYLPSIPRTLYPLYPLSLVPSIPCTLYPLYPLSLVPSIPRTLYPSYPLSLVPFIRHTLYPFYLYPLPYPFLPFPLSVEYSKALPLLTLLTETNNFNQAGVWLKHAESHHMLQELDQAAISYRKVLSLAPHHTETRMTLASLYSQLGMTEDALLLLDSGGCVCGCGL